MTANLHFALQTRGWLGTPLVPGMPESRQNVFFNNELPPFFSHFPLTSLQNGRKPRADDEANCMRFILWLSCSIGDCTGKAGESKCRPYFFVHIKILLSILN